MSDDDFPDAPDDFAQFDANLSLTDPLKDYQKLIEVKLMAHIYVPDEMKEEIWDKIDAGARDAVWKLLFNEHFAPELESMLEKAAKLLKEHKSNAVYYSPYEYNEWIYKVRDELLKREMFDFWKNIVVVEQLGPAWARDSDFFDDMSDPEPEAFYKFAGCVAAWLKNGQ